MITSKNARSRLLIVLLFIIVVFAFPGCNLNNIQVYKQVGKTEIDAYAATKVEINYSAYNWEVLCNVVDWGKSSIDEATTKPHIDTIIGDRAFENCTNLTSVSAMDNLEHIRDSSMYSLKTVQFYDIINM